MGTMVTTIRQAGVSDVEGCQVRRRTLMGAVASILVLGGCGSSGEKHTDEEWNQLLIDALEPLEHVAELTDFHYSMKGVLGAKNSAWISGIVESNTDDATINETLRDEVGKTLATVHRNNPVKSSNVMVYVRSPSMMSYKFRDEEDQPVSSLETLSRINDVDR